MRTPAPFQLIAAMNPCPCGYHGSDRCDCSPDRVARYQKRVSGPLLDRIDMQIQVELPDRALLINRSNNDSKSESSAKVKQRVEVAQNIQLDRQGKTNSKLTNSELNIYAPINSASKKLIYQAMDKFQLSARGLHKVLRVGRTIADLENSDFETQHIKQALSYRDISKLNS